MADQSLKREEFVCFQTEIRQEFREIRDSLRRLSVECHRGRYDKNRGFEDHRYTTCSTDVHVKVDIPIFSGHFEKFLDWLIEVEQLFEYMEIHEHKRVQLVAFRLKGVASAWWENLQFSRTRVGKSHIRTWPKMKRLLMRRFLLSNYEMHQVLSQEFQTCKQGPNLSQVNFLAGEDRQLTELGDQEFEQDVILDICDEEEVVVPSDLQPIFDSYKVDEVSLDFSPVCESLVDETGNAYKMFDQSPKRDLYQFSVYTSPNIDAMLCSATTFVQSEEVRENLAMNIHMSIENSASNHHPVREVEPPDKLLVSRTNYESFIQLIPHVNFNLNISKLNLYVCAKYIFLLSTFSKPRHEKIGSTISGLWESMACRLAFATSVHNLMDNICLWLLCVHGYEDSLCRNYSSHFIHDLIVKMSCDKNCGATKLLRELVSSSETAIRREPKPLYHSKEVDIYDSGEFVNLESKFVESANQIVDTVIVEVLISFCFLYAALYKGHLSQEVGKLLSISDYNPKVMDGRVNTTSNEKIEPPPLLLPVGYRSETLTIDWFDLIGVYAVATKMIQSAKCKYMHACFQDIWSSNCIEVAPWQVVFEFWRGNGLFHDPVQCNFTTKFCAFLKLSAMGVITEHIGDIRWVAVEEKEQQPKELNATYKVSVSKFCCWESLSLTDLSMIQSFEKNRLLHGGYSKVTQKILVGIRY